jgi:hypothetical protein
VEAMTTIVFRVVTVMCVFVCIDRSILTKGIADLSRLFAWKILSRRPVS